MNKRFEIDDMIGEYRVTGFLGEGGMGVVYRGVHQKLDRPTAIKIFGTSNREPSFKTRFFNEARLQAGLHHPNIATLYDFREEDEHLFIFMELVDGESLDDLVGRRAFTIEETLNVFASICEAIGFIHRNGVIHRDIKAQNAKLTAAGSVKLLDFGIAQDSSTQGLTQTGGVIGTPNYLSPEQLEGGSASRQTDIWSLGVLLYEMLTGHLPFQGDTLGGLVLKITRAEFPSPETLNPVVTKDVTAVVAKCLKKNVSARYQTVEDLLLDVRRTLEARGKSGVSFKPAAFTAKGKPAGNSHEARQVGEHIPLTAAPEARPFPVAIAAAVGSGVIFLLFVGVLGIYFLSGSSDGNGNSDGNAQTSTVPLASNKRGVRIHVHVDEGKAEVIRAGKSMGTTPFELDANVGDIIPLTLHRDGFEDRKVTVEVTNGKKDFTFSLKAK
ncbi:MAG: serine/threonine-protein kinase [Pyrinomonadaceae bacterium]